MEHPYATCAKIAVNRLARLRMATTLSSPLRSRIGMFHDVVADGEPLQDEYACHIGTLAERIEAHRAAGFLFVSLDELLALPRAKAREGYCALTFDDGYASLYELAAPLLDALDVPFTAYITTGYLDTDGYLTTDALRALSESPLCTVGSHLVTHAMTRFMDRDAVLAEMTESKRVLESITGKPVRHLAFPYGSAYACSLRDVFLARRAGYRSAALTTATVLDFCRPCRDYTLPRLNMFAV